MRTWRACAMTMALVAVAVLPLAAQSSKWAEPYQNALKTLDSKTPDYAAAVRLLQQAVAAEPRSSANKVIEGVFRIDYFPYYYLGVAYFELQQFEKAEENFNKAQGNLSRPLLAKLQTYRSQIAAKESPARAANQPSPKPAGPNPNFEPTFRAAETALGAKRFADAIAAFDSAKNADAAEFGRVNGQARRDEAARGAAGERLSEDAQQLLQRSQLGAAKAKFQQAEQTFAGLKSVSDGLAEIRQREESYQRLKAAAEQDARNNPRAAIAKFAEAKTTNPEQFAADQLEARVKTLNDRLREAPVARGTTPQSQQNALVEDARKTDAMRLFDRAKLLAEQGKYADAERGFAGALAIDPSNQAADDALQKSRRFASLRTEANDLLARGNTSAARDRLADARTLDTARFDREGLRTMLDRTTAAPPPPAPGPRSAPDADRAPFREALIALLQGNAERTVSLLEPIASRTQTGTQSAALHAYLGVAYATQALSSAKQDEASRALREKALAEFRRAVVEQPDYKLSPRVVSPKIVALFEQARAS